MRQATNKYRSNPSTQSAMSYVLSGLIPFTEANLKLAFSPNRFFNDLEKISADKSYKKQTLRNAYYEARRKGMLEFDDQGIPRLTAKGEQLLMPYVPEKLADGAVLFVIFDIPENERRKRQRLRMILRELKFQQVQKSVWMSPYDCRKYLQAEIEYSDLGGYVEVFEAQHLF